MDFEVANDICRTLDGYRPRSFAVGGFESPSSSPRKSDEKGKGKEKDFVDLSLLHQRKGLTSVSPGPANPEKGVKWLRRRRIAREPVVANVDSWDPFAEYSWLTLILIFLLPLARRVNPF